MITKALLGIIPRRVFSLVYPDASLATGCHLVIFLLLFYFFFTIFCKCIQYIVKNQLVYDIINARQSSSPRVDLSFFFYSFLSKFLEKKKNTNYSTFGKVIKNKKKKVSVNRVFLDAIS